ncbi:hypothetical protein MKX07_007311 [Trichoderma sp. CBMAI-0711]|nr:hypothetical protein MKX07_007311 [Trichoderma sp. CBMAI-0711]
MGLGRVIRMQLQPQDQGSKQLNGHVVCLEERVVKLLLRHVAAVEDLAAQLKQLQGAEHVAGLVERPVVAVEGAADLGLGGGALVADPFDEQVDALLGREEAEVELDGEDDAGAAVHAPEHGADAVLGRLEEVAALPEDVLPVHGPALGAEGRAEELAVAVVPLAHEELQPVARDHLVEGRRARKVAVVAAHHHLLELVRHVGRRVGHHDERPAEEEGGDALHVGAHHGHARRLLGQRRHRHQVVLLDEGGALAHQPLDEARLLAGRHRVLLDRVERLLPVVAVAELLGRGLHLQLAVVELLLGQRDELLRRVGDHLRLELRQQRLAAQGLADDVARLALVHARQLALDERDKVREGVVGRLPRRRRPPVEHGVVRGVEGVELVQVAAQLRHHLGRPERRRLADLDAVVVNALPDLVDQPGNVVELLRHPLVVQGVHVPPRLAQRRDELGKGDQPLDLLVGLLLGVQLVRLAPQKVAQQQKVDLVRLAEGLKVEAEERLELVREVAAQALVAARRHGDAVEGLELLHVDADPAHAVWQRLGRRRLRGLGQRDPEVVHVAAASHGARPAAGARQAAAIAAVAAVERRRRRPSR